jgi:ferredoxin-type protein NapG
MLGGIKGLEQVGGQIAQGAADRPGPQRNQPKTWLRPPGALQQTDFADRCSRCGDCVAACPAQCIELDTPQNLDEDRPPMAGGLPYIVAREKPCVVCDELACMAACPTGALTQVQSASQIRMGSARVDHVRCLRTAPADGDTELSADGEDCRICIEQCPLAEEAIGLDAGGLVEVRAGCIGCGVCEWACPTEPASIAVVPSERAGKRVTSSE